MEAKKSSDNMLEQFHASLGEEARISRKLGVATGMASLRQLKFFEKIVDRIAALEKKTS